MKDLNQLVTEAVNDKISNKTMFTSYDITTELRRTYKFKIMHNQVKNIVRNLFESGQMGSYTANLGNFPNLQGMQPWIYHDILDNHLNYGNTTPTPSVPTVSSTSVLDADDEEVYTVDARGTLCVPAKLIRNLGLSKKDKAYVHIDFLNSVLSLDKDAANATGSYTVDDSNNIRITQKTLDRAGMKAGKYKIDLNGVKILITLDS